jgi:hypothetical protein
VGFDLDVLIEKIYISPRASEAFRQAVADLLKGSVRMLDKPLVVSSLYDAPGYSMDLTLPD